jgi:hypothetical protein
MEAGRSAGMPGIQALRDGGGVMMMSSELEMPTVSCLRCGATYPEGAVVCFRCGAPIGDTSAPTQPVRRSQALPPADTTSSAAAFYSGPIEQDRVPTRPRTRADAALVIVKRPPLTPVDRWERRGRVAFGVFLVLLIAGALGGAALGVRALLAGPPVPHETVYQDPQLRFRFKRPALWSATPASDGVLLTDSAGTSTLRVTISTPARDETAESHADSIAAASQNLSVGAPESFASAQWQVVIGEVTGRDGVVREVEDYITLHGNQLYVIELTSPIANFDGIDNVVYQPLLASFAFA